MNKIFKIVTVALILVLSFSAQSQEKTGITLKGGLNINNTYEDNKAKGADFGFHLGATFDVFSGVVGLETGLLFDTRGYKQKIENQDTKKTVGEQKNPSYEEKQQVYGLTIPVLAKFSLGLSDDITLFAKTGPFANIALFSTDTKKTNTGVANVTKKENQEPENDEKRFSFGFNFGTGLKYKSVSVELGYDLGLTSVAPSNQIVKKDITQGTLKISLGYMF